jgi:hypothetical protein
MMPDDRRESRERASERARSKCSVSVCLMSE